MEIVVVLGTILVGVLVATAIAAGFMAAAFVCIGLHAMIEWADNTHDREQYANRLVFSAKGFIASTLVCGFSIGIAVSINNYL